MVKVGDLYRHKMIKNTIYTVYSIKGDRIRLSGTFDEFVDVTEKDLKRDYKKV